MDAWWAAMNWAARMASTGSRGHTTESAARTAAYCSALSASVSFGNSGRALQMARSRMAKVAGSSGSEGIWVGWRKGYFRFCAVGVGFAGGFALSRGKPES